MKSGSGHREGDDEDKRDEEDEFEAEAEDEGGERKMGGADEQHAGGRRDVMAGDPMMAGEGGETQSVAGWGCYRCRWVREGAALLKFLAANLEQLCSFLDLISGEDHKIKEQRRIRNSKLSLCRTMRGLQATQLRGGRQPVVWRFQLQ